MEQLSNAILRRFACCNALVDHRQFDGSYGPFGFILSNECNRVGLLPMSERKFGAPLSNVALIQIAIVTNTTALEEYRRLLY